MPKKPRVRTLMDSQHVKGFKGSESLLKSARQCFCNIFWKLWKEISSKNAVLVVPGILRVFADILTPHDKYSLFGKAGVKGNQLKCNYLQIKIICSISFRISRIFIKFGILWKKRWASVVIGFLNYRLAKVGLVKCLKIPVSDHLRKANRLKGRKYCLNLHYSILVKFFEYSEKKSARKIPF